MMKGRIYREVPGLEGTQPASRRTSCSMAAKASSSGRGGMHMRSQEELMRRTFSMGRKSCTPPSGPR